MVVWKRFLEMIRRATALWRSRSLEQVLIEAKNALGERMLAADIDDGQIGAEIALLDEKMLQTTASRVVSALMVERRKLVLRLAEAALEDDAPLPGADDEYRKVREVQAKIRIFNPKHVSAGSYAASDKLIGVYS
jgi:hypothetical protein